MRSLRGWVVACLGAAHCTAVRWNFSSLEGWSAVGNARSSPSGLVLSSDNESTAAVFVSRAVPFSCDSNRPLTGHLYAPVPVQWAGKPSTGDYTAVLAYNQFALHPTSGNHYEAALHLALVVDGRYNQSSQTGNATKMIANPLVSPPGATRTVTTFFTASVGNGSCEASSPAQPANAAAGGEILIARRNGTVSAWYRTPSPVGSGETSWVALNYPVSSLPDPLQAERFRMGILMDPNYNAVFSVTVPAVLFLADADGDGLQDDEEQNLGTDPARRDTDGDGIDDFADILPLDPTFRWPFPIVPMLGAGDFAPFLTAKIGAPVLASSLLLIVNNSNNANISLSVHLPELPNGVVQVVSGSLARGGESLPCSSGGFNDVVRPFERVAYQLPAGWNPVLVNPSLALTGVTIRGSLTPGESCTLSACVDLTSAVVRPRGKSSWTWAIVRGGSTAAYSAQVNASGYLVVTRNSPTSCAITSNLTLSGRVASRFDSRDKNDTLVSITMPITAQGVLKPSVITNGNFTTPSPSPDTPLDAWSSFTWQGTFTSERCTSVSYDSGGAAAELRGWAPGKFGISQRVTLPSGTFELGAMVAAYGAEPGLFGNTFSFLLIIDGGRTIGDISLLPTQQTGMNWTPFRGTFSLDNPANATVYFRAWSAGFFFVDNVWLSMRECATQVEDLFQLGEPVKPLAFTPPVEFEDLLLCGYCSTGGVSARNNTVCSRCASANRTALEPPTQANTSLTLENYTTGHRPLFIPSPCANVTADPPALELGQNCFIETDPQVLVSDWSHYARLTFSIENPTSTPQSIYVEIDDCQSKDYWSRVDYYTFAPPGSATIVVPIDVAVGEKSEIGVYRRPLKVNCITRIAIEWQLPIDSTPVTANVTLALGPITLEPRAALVHDFAKLLKLDVQPRAAPVEPGFTGFYGAMYTGLRGYGLIPGTRIFETQDRGHPTALWRDWIAFEEGGIRIDLPNGDYSVAMCLVDPGYWEYYQNWMTRSVVAENIVVLNESMTLEQFYSEYFANELTEDLPGDSSWDRYISPRYIWKRFSVSVSDEALDVEFDCPTTFGCTLSSMIIYPTASETQAQQYVAELEGAMKQRYAQGYLQYVPNAKARDSNPTTPIVAFQRDSGIDVGARDEPTPAEIIPASGTLAAVRVAPSSTVSFTFTVLPSLQWVGGDVANVTITNLGDGITAEISTVRFKQSRMTADGSVWTAAPILLDPLTADSRAIPSRMLHPGLCRRIWCTVVSGSSAALKTAGQRLATVTMTFTGSAPKLQFSLPIMVSILTLPVPTEWLGYLGSAPLYTETVWSAVANRQWLEHQPALNILKSHGMTAATGGLGGPVYSGRAPNGTVLLNFTAFDASMVAITAAFPGVPVNTYGGLNIIGDVSNGSDLSAVASSIASHVKSHQWPTVFESIADEPADQDTIDSDDAAAAAIAVGGGDSLRSAAFTSFVTTSDPRAELVNHTSLIVLGEHSNTSIDLVRAKNKQWMLYNGGSRFKRGFYMCRLRQLGCRGHYEFAFSSVHADPYYALDSREDDLCAVRTTSIQAQFVREVNLLRLGAGTRDLGLCIALQHRISTTAPSLRRTECANILNKILELPVGSNFEEWDAETVTNVSAAVFDCISDL